MLYMCGSVVYKCIVIRCCYGSASVSCKVLARGIYFIVVCVLPFKYYSEFFCGIRHQLCDYSLWGVFKDKVFTHSPRNLAGLHAAIETEFETLHATPDFARRVCHILRNRCLACIAEGGSHFEHKM